VVATVEDAAVPVPASGLETVGDEGVGPAPSFSPEVALDPEPDRSTIERALERAAAENEERGQLGSAAGAEVERAFDADSGSDSDAERVGPAWLYAAPQTPRPRANLEVTPSFAGETLQGSRERVASRWFALKGVFENVAPELPAAMQPLRSDYVGTPLLLVFSLAGGVGKTSLVAALGRALSAQGEKVLLTDTTSHGLLPFYFGARELRPGAMRTFSPPEGSNDAPIYLVSYKVESREEGEPTPEIVRRQQSLIDEIFRTAQDSNRVVLDLSAGASWLIRGMAGLNPTVLIPMAPDMNSVISLHAVERFFQGIVDSDGRPVLPFYLLNQFDATLPLHLDVREVFRRQLGDRLLNFVIRRSPAVSEALAEGMTVIDYAPEAAVSKDYFNVSAWLRSVSPAAEAGLQSAGWVEP
jgi:cellulose synthase operon protein YhjQ